MVPLYRVASDSSDFVLTGQRLSLGAQRVFVSLFHDCVSNETSFAEWLVSTSLIQLSPSGVVQSCTELLFLQCYRCSQRFCQRGFDT